METTLKAMRVHAIFEAAGVPVDYMRVRGFPFSDDVTAFIDAHEEVFVVEQNRDAQLMNLLITETSAPKVQKLEDVLTVVAPGFVNDYLTSGRNMPQRVVTLRQVGTGAASIYGEAADWIASEALLRLDLGLGRLPALLVIGSEDPHQFRPSQGTDLLTFFTGVFERSMKRFLG